jgi:uncharacterized membrane-anchored protein YhcB (DUF1043 family)
MSDSTINLLLQIPLAGVVVLVVVLFLRFLEKNTQQMITFMQDQANTNREFLKSQREQTNAAIGRLAEENKEMRNELSKLATIMDSFLNRLPLQKRNRNM